MYNKDNLKQKIRYVTETHCSTNPTDTLSVIPDQDFYQSSFSFSFFVLNWC